MTRKYRNAKGILTQMPGHSLPLWASPESPNAGKNLISRLLLNYFYYDRFDSVINLIKKSEDFKKRTEFQKYALDIGSGVGTLLILISNLGYKTIGIDSYTDDLKKTPSKHHVVWGYVPPLPFSDSTFDLITVIGLTEHAPDEELFVKEVYRVLKPNGDYICTIPVEICIAGLIRHIAKNIAYPHRTDCKSIFDYSIDELRGNCPRNMHEIWHKYYNYKYLLNDLKDTFNSVNIHPWPKYSPKFLAPILIARCTK